MAAAVNVTGTSVVTESGDEGGNGKDARPSVFELVSQHGFAHALRPAFLHIAKSFAERYPEGIILRLLYRRFDEAYLAFDSLVQLHLGSTLSESFYGLARNCDGASRHQRILLSFILSAILPYIKTKLDKWHQNLNNSVPNTPQDPRNNSTNAVVERFRKYYPYFKAFLDLVNFWCLLRYTFGYSKSHNLLFLSLGLRFSYASPSRKSTEGTKLELCTPHFCLKRCPTLILRSLGDSILLIVELGSFSMQFLDWWYNDPKHERVVLTSLPVPPPMSAKSDHFIAVAAQEKKNCPLCRKQFKNATALSTSGLVYCYGCISPYIKQHGQCPLTSIKSTKDHIIRIYSD